MSGSTFSFVAKSLDQIDLALEQLNIDGPNSIRFALMLVDNCVELLLHRRATDADLTQRMFPRHAQTFSENDLRRALDRYFDPKVNFARDVGLMTEIEAENVSFLHEFRNAAYHKGIQRESVLSPLTAYYLQIACKLFLAYEPPVYSKSSNDITSERIQKYITDPKSFSIESVMFKAAWPQLADAVEDKASVLTEKLTRDMKREIEDFDDSLTFLESESPDKVSRNEHLILCQAWDFIFSEAGELFTKEAGLDQVHPVALVGKIINLRRWPHEIDPILGWNRRLERLAQERDSAVALNKYCHFMKQTDKVRSLVSQAANRLEMAIERQINQMRGK